MHVYLQDAPRVIALVADNLASTESLSQQPNHTSSTTAIIISSQPPTSTPASTSPAANSLSAAQATSSSRAIVEVVKAQELHNLSLQKLTPRPICGCLGLINVGQDLFVAVVTSAQEVGAIRPGEVVMKVTSVAFYCVNRSTWDDTIISDAATNLDPYDALGPGTDGAVTQPSVYEHPCASLKKLLGTGTFYYAKDANFDISTRLDRRFKDSISARSPQPFPDGPKYDGRFVWNSYMIEPLINFRNRLEPADQARIDAECFFLLVIQGFVRVYEMPAHASGPPSSVAANANSPPSVSGSSGGGVATTMTRSPSSLAVISRLSWKRAGTRFNTRGVDDDGNVANFVESETIFSHDNVIFSLNQVRGSVPLFWEQQGLQAFNARIQITRSRVASQPAFDRHFAELISHYSQIHAINLLGTRDAETVLSSAYAEHMKYNSAEKIAVLPPEEGATGPDLVDDITERVGLTNFDFHTISRNMGGLEGVRNELQYLGPVQLKRKAFAFTVIDTTDGSLLRRQKGVFRTNCLDCLDRTNVVQDFISQSSLESFFEAASGRRPSFEPFIATTHPIWTHHRVLWAENGDALSKIYAGTGALNTSFTRSGKKTLGGLLSDAAKSAGRMYINNFQDKGKQNVIDVLLGNMANQRPVTVFDPIVDSVTAELRARVDEYSSSKTISIFTGTFNLNGKPPGESLSSWLFPDGEEEEPDIFAIGFQEIVQLTPQQILMTDPDKIRIWEGKIVDTLSRRAKKRSDYILLRSEQLVGTALIILVKEGLINEIRQVEAATKKTGLKGMSGNKGGVAIRLDYFDTSICFVTGHFAAGHSNFEERNADYWTISRGLSFQRGRTIASHDHVMWLGDFNYRIDLPNEAVRAMATSEDFGALYARDQLGRGREVGAVFPGFEEGVILFAPTYKYDNGSSVYDSSEKQRIPAWTDRILYRGQGLEQRSYFRAELKTSDHRPVYAQFRAQVRIVDHAKKAALKAELLHQQKEVHGLGIRADDEADEDLPEPSDEHSNWWHSNGADHSPSLSSEDDEDPEGWTSVNPFRPTPAPPTATATSKPPPPPVPTKPAAVSAAITAPSQRPAPAAAPAMPKIPPRPKLGPRSASYSSQRSAKSLLDSSDSDEEPARFGAALSPPTVR